MSNLTDCPGCAAEARARTSVLASPDGWRLLAREAFETALARIDIGDQVGERWTFLAVLDFEQRKALRRRARAVVAEAPDLAAWGAFVAAEDAAAWAGYRGPIYTARD